MSYDLGFRVRKKKPPLRAELQGHFRGRKHYGIDDDQIGYENPDTGVYFHFFLGEGAALPAFNLNYNRPHTFGLEAEPEVRAFVERFDLDVDDPQCDGMSQGRYSREGFLKGWNAGNAFGCRAAMAHGIAAKTLPREVIERVWGWNLAREDYQDRLESLEMIPCFVPKVSYLDLPGTAEVQTVAVWPEGIPVALPQVDVVIVMFEPRGAPRLLPWERVAPLTARSQLRSSGHRFKKGGVERVLPISHHLLVHDDPAPIAAALAGMPALEPGERPTMLAPEQVLTRDVVQGPGS